MSKLELKILETLEKQNDILASIDSNLSKLNQVLSSNNDNLINVIKTSNDILPNKIDVKPKVKADNVVSS